MPLAAFVAVHEPLRTGADKVLRRVHDALPDRSWVFIHCDHHGRVLNLVANRSTEKRCARAGIRPGTSLSEESCGTNAVALAMRLGHMVVIRGSDHYCSLFEDWSCIAAPVTLPGESVAGYLDLSLHHEDGLGPAIAIFDLTLELLQNELAHQPFSKGCAPSPEEPPVRRRSLPTLRQKEALALYGAGLSLAEIARRMTISEHAVKKHLQKVVRARLGTENNRAAYYEAVRRGIVPPPGREKPPLP